MHGDWTWVGIGTMSFIAAILVCILVTCTRGERRGRK